MTGFITMQRGRRLAVPAKKTQTGGRRDQRQKISSAFLIWALVFSPPDVCHFVGTKFLHLSVGFFVALLVVTSSHATQLVSSTIVGQILTNF